jgi:hypothetical protein
MDHGTEFRVFEFEFEFSTPEALTCWICLGVQAEFEDEVEWSSSRKITIEERLGATRTVRRGLDSLSLGPPKTIFRSSILQSSSNLERSNR